MFIDQREYDGPEQIDADVGIVGAGAAGITLAMELTGSNRNVCLLESGGFEYHGPTQLLAAGETAGFPYYELVASRLRYFGGTTNHWAGVSCPLDEIDFEVREGVPNSGWPFGRAALDPFYDRAHAYCRLGPYDYDPRRWATDAAPQIRLSERVRTQVKLENPLRFGQAYRNELGASPNVRIFLHANATGLEPVEDGTAIARISARTLEGRRISVAAKDYVIATGAIENARLLLASRSVHPEGIGNDHGLVGRYFMEHPMAPAMELQLSGEGAGLQFYTGQVRNGLGVTGYFTLAPETLRREGLLNACAAVNFGRVDQAAAKSLEGVASAVAIWNAAKEGGLPPNLGEHVAKLAGDLHRVAIYSYQRAFERSPTTASIVVEMEQAPDPASRVELTGERDPLGIPKVRLTWRLGELERRTIVRFGEILGMEVGRAGIGRIRLVEPNEDGWWDGLRGAWHHMGTTRMHARPEQGVVDPDCRVHGMRNLFVAGGSVFPTSGFANPTLTIVALAIRLADRLKRLET